MIAFSETIPLARAWAREQLRSSYRGQSQFTRKGQASTAFRHYASTSSSVDGQSKTALSNLVSVKDSLGVFRSSENGGVVFVDGSFYHKGERNGRKEYVLQLFCAVNTFGLSVFLLLLLVTQCVFFTDHFLDSDLKRVRESQELSTVIWSISLPPKNYFQS